MAALYLDSVGPLAPSDPVWWTLRRRRGDGPPARRPLNYDALRAVLRRVNDALGTNWTMHDLRHTCARRMLRDRNLSLRDIQTILGHACLLNGSGGLRRRTTPTNFDGCRQSHPRLPWPLPTLSPPRVMIFPEGRATKLPGQHQVPHPPIRVKLRWPAGSVRGAG
ncbi:tyrosine-type recombinase/integrase [Streptomyces sp. NPDC002586]